MLRIPLAVVALVVMLAGQAVAQSQPDRPASPRPDTPSAVVNLNTATSGQLQELPGIGARTAERIIQYREKNGPFKKIEELMNVQGIGEKTFLKLKPQITVGGKPTQPAAERQ
jgi:competence protein ComEA